MDSQSQSQTLSTTLNRTWLLKIGIFTVVLFGFGLWGLFDATIAYPNRGRDYASWAKLAYLEKAAESGRLFSASVESPREEYLRLRAEQKQIRQHRDQAEIAGRTSEANARELELMRLEWLTALARIGELKAANTTIEEPRETLTALRERWQAANPPKRLDAYDIPFQWFLVVVGFGGGLWLLLLIFKVSRRTFHYRPDTKTLILNDGREISPADISEVDKRKWDKFFVFLHLKSGGDPIKLDLLRYKHLEDWVLEMEKDTEGYEPPETSQSNEPEATETPAQHPESAGDLPEDPDGSARKAGND